MERKSLQPIYVQVAESLKLKIDDGFYQSGSKLPSESQLVEKLGVSRVTIRKALQQLNDIGYTLSEKGKGTFVAYRKLKHDFVSMTGFTQELEGTGLKVCNKLMHFEVLPCDADLANRLRITEGSLVSYACRLRFINDQVVSYEEFYIPRAILPELDERALLGSKFKYLKAQQIEMVKTHQKIKPAMPSKKIQQLFSISDLELILINESLNYLDEDTPYEYSLVYYKASVYDFEITARLQA